MCICCIINRLSGTVHLLVMLQAAMFEWGWTTTALMAQDCGWVFRNCCEWPVDVWSTIPKMICVDYIILDCTPRCQLALTVSCECGTWRQMNVTLLHWPPTPRTARWLVELLVTQHRPSPPVTLFLWWLPGPMCLRYNLTTLFLLLFIRATELIMLVWYLWGNLRY